MANNLLSKTPLTTVNPQAQVYLVYDNKDYRASLAAILALVTKTSLGLDKVNNTSDLEKPISNQTQDALNQRALKTEVPTLEAFDQLTNSLQNYVTLDQLNSIIQNLSQAIEEVVSSEEMNQAIATAISPLSDALLLIQQRLTTAEQKILALEQDATTYAKQSTVNSTIQSLTNNWNSQFAALTDSTQGSISTLNQQIGSIIQTVSNIQTTLQQKADKPIQLEDIEGLEVWVRDIIGESSVVWMVGDW